MSERAERTMHTVSRALTALVRLYPRAWRERYGAGLTALVEETPPSPRVAADLVKGATVAHARQRPGAATWLAAAVATALCEVAAYRAGVTRNVLWAPTDADRAACLGLTLAPLAAAFWIGRWRAWAAPSR